MPHVSLTLDWTGDLKFRNGEGSPAIELESGVPGVTSPPQALAYAVMACMGMDVVHVIRKGRYDLEGLHLVFEGERAEEHPRRYLAMTLKFIVTGDVPDHVVERAIDLSRTKYCTVWNTIRTDVRLDTSFEIRRP
ncbi:MAG: OsmC family protein [Vicinamibacterales bacterium]